MNPKTGCGLGLTEERDGLGGGCENFEVGTEMKLNLNLSGPYLTKNSPSDLERQGLGRVGRTDSLRVSIDMRQYRRLSYVLQLRRIRVTAMRRAIEIEYIALWIGIGSLSTVSYALLLMTLLGTTCASQYELLVPAAT